MRAAERVLCGGSQKRSVNDRIFLVDVAQKIEGRDRSRPSYFVIYLEVIRRQNYAATSLCAVEQAPIRMIDRWDGRVSGQHVLCAARWSRSRGAAGLEVLRLLVRLPPRGAVLGEFRDASRVAVLGVARVLAARQSRLLELGAETRPVRTAFRPLVQECRSGRAHPRYVPRRPQAAALFAGRGRVPHADDTCVRPQ